MRVGFASGNFAYGLFVAGTASSSSNSNALN
jgi:hypothetical protein